LPIAAPNTRDRGRRSQQSLVVIYEIGRRFDLSDFYSVGAAEGRCVFRRTPPAHRGPHQHPIHL